MKTVNRKNSDNLRPMQHQKNIINIETRKMATKEKKILKPIIYRESGLKVCFYFCAKRIGIGSNDMIESRKMDEEIGALQRDVHVLQ